MTGWQHYIDCNCPWCVGNNTSHSRNSDDDFFPVKDSPYESYTILTKCPAGCGSEVFFYRSPYDGRVFFDPPLGPPWNKHPCTSNSSDKIIEIIPDQIDLKKRLAGNWDLFDCGHSERRKLSAEEITKCILDLIDKKKSSTEVPDFIHDLIKGSTYHGDVDETIIYGRLVKIRKKRQIKVIKKGIMKPGVEDEYVFNDSIRLRFRISETAPWFEENICIFEIYPTFVREHPTKENMWQISSFVLHSPASKLQIITTEAELF